MNTDKNDIKKNNRIGKYKNAYVAMIYGTHRFVHISTDKAVNPRNIMGVSKRLCELIIQSFDKMIKAHKELEIPVLHVHHEDEDGNMYPLSNGTKKVDENGNNIFTFPCQNDKGHRKAQTEYSLVRFGDDYIIWTIPVRPYKQWFSCGENISIVLSSCCNYNDINEKHQLSIPNLNPILVEIVKVSTYMLRKYLRLARSICNKYQMLSKDIFGLFNDAQYTKNFDNGVSPLLI